MTMICIRPATVALCSQGPTQMVLPPRHRLGIVCVPGLPILKRFPWLPIPSQKRLEYHHIVPPIPSEDP